MGNRKSLARGISRAAGIVAVIIAATWVGWQGRPAEANAIQSTTFPATEDSYISRTHPKRNFGRAWELRASRSGGSRTLLRFKITRLNYPSYEDVAIPTDAIIQSVTLVMTRHSKRVRFRSFAVHEADGRWSQRNVTWHNAPRVGKRIRQSDDTEYVPLPITIAKRRTLDLYLTVNRRSARSLWHSRESHSPPILQVRWSEPQKYGSGSGYPTDYLSGAGDIASCDSAGDEATAALLDTIGGTIFTLGDNVYDTGSADEFAQCYEPSWGRHKERTRPAAGNHDYGGGATGATGSTGATGMPTAASYFNYFGAAAGDPAQGWYSYNIPSGWHVIVLNSNCGAVGGCETTSPQGRWLAADLVASGAKCTLAYWHHPRFSSGPHGNSDQVEPFWNLLYTAGAEIVLSGHDHSYERFAPQAPDGTVDPKRGIRQFVVGTGGKSLYPIGVPKPNSEVADASTAGVLTLELRDRSSFAVGSNSGNNVKAASTPLLPPGYDWKFTPVTGGTFTDSGSGYCH